MTNHFSTIRRLRNTHVFSFIILLASLPFVSLMAQPDNSGKWVANPDAHVIYEGSAYKLDANLSVNQTTYDPFLETQYYYLGGHVQIPCNGNYVPVARWHQICPDTLGLKHERVASGAPEHVSLSMYIHCDENHDYSVVKPLAPAAGINPYGNLFFFFNREIGSYAFADYDHYFTPDGRVDSIVFHPTKITSFSSDLSPLVIVGAYAFAECRDMEGEISVCGHICRGAFNNCRRLSLSITPYCYCDSLIGDSLRKVSMGWTIPKFPIFNYADTIVVPRGYKAEYESLYVARAGIIIEGDEAESPQLPQTAYTPPKMHPNRTNSHIYLYDDHEMLFWLRYLGMLIYDNLSYYADNDTKPSFPYPNEPYVIQGYDKTLTVYSGWQGRCTDTADMARWRYAGCLDDDVIVPEYMYIDESEKSILGVVPIGRTGVEVGNYYVVTQIGMRALCDSTRYYDKANFPGNFKTAAYDKVTYRSLRSLKLPKTIMRICEYGFAHNYLLTEHYDLPLLEYLGHGALLGCRHVSINIPSKCFCERYVADTLRKVSVHWTAPNNNFPICQYVDTLVVPRGTKELYAQWKGMEAGIIIEDDYDAERTQPVTHVMTPTADRPAGSGGDAIYDLQGRRLSSPPQRGIYIKNRKKFFVR